MNAPAARQLEGRIAKNTTYLTVASILQKVISFIYFGILAKTIGYDALGKYTSALAWTSIFIVFMDFGLGQLLTREGAKDEQHLQHHFERMLLLKGILMCCALFALFASILIGNALFTNITNEDVGLVALASLIIIFDTLTFTVMSLFRALKRIHYEAFGIILYQATILVAGLSAMRAHLPLPYILGALLAGSMVQFIYLTVILHWKTPLRFRLRWNSEDFVPLLRLAAPFAIAGIVFRLNGTADSLMIKVMDGNAAAGWYGVAFRLTFALTVLPGAFATSYFPAVSAAFQHARDRLAHVVESGFTYMIVLSFPIMVGVLILGDDIVLRVWDSFFQPSIMPLRILICALPFIFLNYPIGNFLNAIGRQTLNTVNMTISLFLNIALNSILIPYYSISGAAAATAISSLVIVCLGLPWVYSLTRFHVGYLLRKIIRVGIAATMMGGILIILQHHYPLLALIGIGALIYSSAVILLGGITKEELRELSAALLRRS